MAVDVRADAPRREQHPRRIYFVSESTLVRDEHGCCWASSNVHRSFAQALHRHFDEVIIALRTTDGPRPTTKATWALPENVSVRPLVPYRGAREWTLRLPKVLARIVSEASRAEYAMLLMPSLNAALFGLIMMLRKRPFAIQMVGDPDIALGAKGMGAAARIARRPMASITRVLCHRAASVAYVTQRTLQARYPGGPMTKVFGVSDVDLAEGDFATEAVNPYVSGPLNIVFCGSLEQRYKGLGVLLNAAKRLADGNLALKLTILGDGFYRAEYERQALRLGLEVEFAGLVPRQDVFAAFRRAHLFVMPSLTEGLPRALIEAMAQGLPAIGSCVGGIPELIDDECLVPPDNEAALAELISLFASNQQLRLRTAERNLQFAKRFARLELDRQRDLFVASIAGARS